MLTNQSNDLDLRTLDAPFGVVVHGITWTVPGPAVLDTLTRALRRHLLLVFRGQPSPTKEELAAFFRPFGRLMSETRDGTAHYNMFSADSTKQVYRKDGTNYIDAAGGASELKWHSDHYHKPQLKKLSVLEALELDEDVVPTLYRDTYTAYEVLPAEIRAQLVNKQGVYYDPRVPGPEEHPRLCDAMHPLFLPQPDSGRLCLYVSEDTARIVGLDDDDSDRYLRLLRDHVETTSPEYAHDWQEGDIVVWDNVGLQHRRDAVPAGSVRRLRVFEGVAE